MAWKDYNTFFGNQREYFYNVTQSVGGTSATTHAAAPNLTTDMMLVCYFLQYFYRYGYVVRYPILKPAQLETIPLPNMIPEWMLNDKKTTINNVTYWIKKFQADTWNKSRDGRVDMGKNLAYTICSMNFIFRDIVSLLIGEQDFMKYMLNDNPIMMPPLLKQELSYDPHGKS